MFWTLQIQRCTFQTLSGTRIIYLRLVLFLSFSLIIWPLSFLLVSISDYNRVRSWALSSSVKVILRVATVEVDSVDKTPSSSSLSLSTFRFFKVVPLFFLLFQRWESTNPLVVYYQRESNVQIFKKKQKIFIDHFVTLAYKTYSALPGLRKRKLAC